jgi:hypothetical protein
VFRWIIAILTVIESSLNKRTLSHYAFFHVGCGMRENRLLQGKCRNQFINHGGEEKAAMTGLAQSVVKCPMIEGTDEDGGSADSTM